MQKREQKTAAREEKSDASRRERAETGGSVQGYGQVNRTPSGPRPDLALALAVPVLRGHHCGVRSSPVDGVCILSHTDRSGR